MMNVSLKLNLTDALTAKELKLLLDEADKRKTTIERVLYDAAHFFCENHPLKAKAKPELELAGAH